MQQQHREHASQTPIQFSNQPQLQQSIQPSMQQIQTSMHSIQPSMQSIQPSMQSIQTSMQPSMQPSMQSIQTSMQPSMQSIQPSMQSMHQIQPSMQSIQQPMMLCPVQFVYETQMLMPQGKTDEQIQHNTTFPQNTYIINVQNPPPWIQNRNMNQFVYMPQLMQKNIQPYVQQNIVQNPMFIQQFQQPMPEQVRMQIPNLIQHNTVQNPQNVVQNTQHMMRLSQMEMKQDKMPLLTQILQEQTNQGVRKSNQPMQNDTQPIQMMRQTYQNIRPQMLTVNPMPSNHSCAHHTQAQVPNVSQPQIISEIPPYIRNQFPEGLSVKSIYKPIPMTMVRPNEYLQNIAPATTIPSNVPTLMPKLVMRNTTTNTDNRYIYKRKLQNAKTETDNAAYKKHCTQLEEDTAKLLCKMKSDAIANKKKMDTQMNNSVENNAIRERLEDKPIRNTVYVQARGRVSESVANEIKNNTNKNEVIQHENSNMRQQQTTNETENSCEVIETKNNENKESNKEIKPDIDRNSPITAITAPITVKSPKKETDIENTVSNNQVETPKVETKLPVKENIDIEEKISQFVLTHVLDGHIIQESNIPFAIKKPSKSPKRLTSHNNTGETEVSFDSLKETTKPDNEIKNTVPNTTLDSVQDEVTTMHNEDNPFKNIRRSTVKPWTVSDLFAHLHNHNWAETAQKLREEEIDGESLLLVNKEQLLNVSIDDLHAEVICSFLDSVN